MKRRDFIEQSMLSMSGIALAKVMFGFNTSMFAPKVTFSPYMVNLEDSNVRTALQSKTLPQVVRSDFEQNVDVIGVRDLEPGEGETTNPLDYDVVSAYNRKIKPHNCVQQGFTPVSILITPNFEVYGQFFNCVIGEIGLIRGFDDAFYKVHPSFNRLFANDYACYGLPASDYSTVTCYKCTKTYLKQQFQRECGQGKYYVYAFASSCSKGGCCDGLDLTRVGPCRIPIHDDGVYADVCTSGY